MDYRSITTNGKETIENVLEHSYEGEIYEIETMEALEPLRITDEQNPVYVLRGQKRD